MTEDSIFTKIIKGEIPSHKIYEDDKTYAFLDIHPIQPGHVLVVPKIQVDNIWDLPDEDYHALMDVTKHIAFAMQQKLEKRVGVQVIGIDVPHAHVHLVPFTDVKEFRAIPDDTAKPNNDELAKMAEILKMEED